MSAPLPGTAEYIIALLDEEICNTFGALLPWFAKDKTVRTFRSLNEEWDIGQVLEHVMQANHYLLILIEKGTKKALKKTDKLKIKQILESYEISNPLLEEIGINNSFEWKCPDHMIPSGKCSLDLIQHEVMKQKSLLRENLHLLNCGEGVLYKTKMSVHSLGRLDVYQYIYFLLKHMQRHIQQMLRIESEYLSSNI
jgi:hypothetical protein